MDIITLSEKQADESGLPRPATDAANESDLPSLLATQWDLLAAVALTAALVIILVFFPDWSAPRFALGLTVGLLLPGYLSVASLFPRAADLDGPERVGLALALSVVIVIVGTVLLATGGIRLNTRTEVIYICAVVGAAATIASLRRLGLPQGESYILRIPRGRYPYLACGLAGATCLVTWAFVSPNLGNNQVDFWISNPSGGLLGYPYQVHTGSRYKLRIHIDNPTDRPASYGVSETYGSGDPVAHWIVHMRPRSHWSAMVVLPAEHSSPKVKVTFALYRNVTQRSGGTPLRKLWVRYGVVAA